MARSFAVAPDAGLVAWPFIVLAVLAVDVWICARIARMAERKGQSFLVFFVVGFLVSPVVSGLIALAIRDPLADERR